MSSQQIGELFNVSAALIDEYVSSFNADTIEDNVPRKPAVIALAESPEAEHERRQIAERITLSDEQYREIERRRLNGERWRDIAPDYGYEGRPFLLASNFYKNQKRQSLSSAAIKKTAARIILTERQWNEIEQRHNSGEHWRSISPDYGYSENRHNTLATVFAQRQKRLQRPLIPMQGTTRVIRLTNAQYREIEQRRSNGEKWPNIAPDYGYADRPYPLSTRFSKWKKRQR